MTSTGSTEALKMVTWAKRVVKSYEDVVLERLSEKISGCLMREIIGALDEVEESGQKIEELEVELASATQEVENYRSSPML